MVKRFMESGWPSDKTHISIEYIYLTFYEKREFLSCEEDILLWNSRLVVPKSLQARILHMLHEGNQGIGSMRALARIYVWWPNIDEDIERYVMGCHSCQENRQNEPETLLYSWNAPTEPWTRIHIDYAGPFEGKYWLIVIDAYSKWLEIVSHQSITTLSTIKSLREIFSRFGVPKIFVSDNGPQFASKEFEAFCYSNNIIHMQSRHHIFQIPIGWQKGLLEHFKDEGIKGICSRLEAEVTEVPYCIQKHAAEIHWISSS